MKAIDIDELLKYPYETEWLEFKTNGFNPNELGEYISAMSNTAAYNGKDFAYLIWGIENKTHEIVGSSFNHRTDINNEPLDHFLARQIKPSIDYKFFNLIIDDKNVVILEVPRAYKVPITFREERYIRIGSSKEKLARFPERESYLWSVLRNGFPTITNTESPYQDLSFDKILIYFAAKGITLNKKTLESNLHLRTHDGKYNKLAQILADENNTSVRVSVFAGNTKTNSLYSVKEFGNTCIFYAMDKVLEYMDIVNIVQADERNRIIERKDVPFVDSDALREAVVNAFVHNLWVKGNAPQFTVYSDRIEIISHGGLPSDQNFTDFFSGVSKPVNEELSVMFLQLRISERSGRGVPKVVDLYGERAYKFTDKSITVTLPFNRIKRTDKLDQYEKVDGKVDSKVDSNLNNSQKRIIVELRNDPNITIPKLQLKLKMSKSGITKNLKKLRELKLIERVGADKNGYWQVNLY